MIETAQRVIETTKREWDLEVGNESRIQSNDVCARGA
jgi:hypothetical protein